MITSISRQGPPCHLCAIYAITCSFSSSFVDAERANFFEGGDEYSGVSGRAGLSHFKND